MADVVVVGAGIVGAAVAYELALAGAAVTLVDKSLPASGVTADSFAWIGGPSGADVPDGSSPLRRGALAAYRRLEAQVPGVRVRWTGSLAWDGHGLPEERSLGPDEHLLDAARIGRLEPNLAATPARALHKDSDGAVDPVRVTDALVAAARAHGARLIVGAAVTAVSAPDGRVTGAQTSHGFLAADTVVITAGVDAPVLCAPLGFELPIAPSPALLLRFTAAPGLVRTLVASPHLEVRQAADGQLLVAAGYHGEASQDDLRRAAHEMLSRLTATFAGPPDMSLVSVRLAARPMPADGLPVIGPLPGVSGVYVAVMHSGVTLAPVAGRLIATEIIDGIEAGELSGVRPARFRAGAGA
ncbi:MAG TPA: FAD-binding oxidoreductase [Jatrophihabitans sp.]|uniref:NAD(P)/FAD-dependent oxidoreductase n=1 Tax=Jatrophihabitans sp. TaxID=1932789 RepID=UPI002F15C352